MTAQRARRSGVIVGTVIVGVLINVLIHTVGTAFGATYEFTAAGRPAKVDALTVAGFTALPLLAGLAAAGALADRRTWVIPAAILVVPVLALGSIVVMILPVDLALDSKIALALCHTMLVPVAIAGLLAVGRPARPVLAPGGSSGA
jgi:Family of unknown function (DUF6069)